ncbi:MAG: MBL fold metallo-hydrolase [Chitinophagales bacterium]|nr:MBL fold metallo-hydrolase [Chitinophagales bacterium]
MKKIKLIIALLVLVPILLVPIKLMSLGKKIELGNLKSYIFNQPSENNKGIEIDYLGTSCFIITYKGHTYLNDPFFSNPNFLELVSGKYPNRDTLINSLIPQKENISLITITHGHYDHCLDFPSFMPYFNNRAKIVASSSALLSLSPWIKNNKDLLQYPIERMAKPNWIYSSDKTFRIYPIHSEHQPHIGRIKLLTGAYEKPLAQAPGPVWQWLEGHTYSYLLDVMDNDTIVKRLLIASGEIPMSSLEKLHELDQEKQIDLLFYPYWHKEKCGTKFEEAYQKLKPQKVIFHHWNNFFRDPNKPIQMIRSSDINNELKKKRTEGYPVSIMIPFSKTSI